MNLHIIHKSAHSHASAQDALALINQQDAVILIDDGTYNAVADTQISQAFSAKSQHCYYLQEHAQARGLNTLSEHFKACSMSDFVNLSLSAKNNISWY